MTTVSTSLEKSQVLSYYYQRRAESSLGTGTRFQFKSVVFGTSSLVTANSDGTYAISDIPTTFALSDMTTQVATGTLTLSYASGLITIRAAMNTSAMDANTSYAMNTMAILDADGKAVMVQCVQQDTVYQGKTYVATITLKTGGAS